mgnify:FL=1
MARKKFVPKKKKTLIPEPDWDKLRKAKTEENKIAAFKSVADFVHFEVSDKEQLHWLKKWIREYSDWNMHEETVVIPPAYLTSFSKYGWIAIRLGFIPDSIRNSLEKNLKPILQRAQFLKDKDKTELIDLPKEPDYFLHPDKVKSWLTTWKLFVTNNKKDEESPDRSIRMRYQSAQSYVTNMQNYLRTGIWNDMWFGERREQKVRLVCKAIAYETDGTVKRNVGTWYPDIQRVWEKNDQTRRTDD